VKIAVATDGQLVAQHFGRCPEYTLAEISDGKLQSKTVIPNPGHEPGFLPGYLANLGVDCIIAGGMGPRAQQLFSQHRIQTIVGVTGEVDRAIQDYIAGQLQAGESLCDHPHGGHGDGHGSGGCRHK